MQLEGELAVVCVCVTAAVTCVDLECGLQLDLNVD